MLQKISNLNHGMFYNCLIACITPGYPRSEGCKKVCMCAKRACREFRLEQHARSARMRTARHKAPCRFVYNAAAAAEMHAPYGRGYAAAGRTSVQCVEREVRCRSAWGLFSKQKSCMGLRPWGTVCLLIPVFCR